MKTCPRCGNEKANKAFSKDRSRKDGLMWMCKECYKMYRLGIEVPKRYKERETVSKLLYENLRITAEKLKTDYDKIYKERTDLGRLAARMNKIFFLILDSLAECPNCHNAIKMPAPEGPKEEYIKTALEFADLLDEAVTWKGPTRKGQINFQDARTG